MPLSTTTLSPYHVSYHLTGILRLVSIKQLHYDGTVWENEKYCGTTSWQVSVSRAFLSSQTFASVSTWYKQEMNIFSISFIKFHDEKWKTTCLLWLPKCKLSLLTSSLHEQLVLHVVVFLLSYENIILNQSAHVFYLSHFLTLNHISVIYCKIEISFIKLM